jgi:hypothetical protein
MWAGQHEWNRTLYWYVSFYIYGQGFGRGSIRSEWNGNEEDITSRLNNLRSKNIVRAAVQDIILDAQLEVGLGLCIKIIATCFFPSLQVRGFQD